MVNVVSSPAFNYARLPYVEDEEPYWRIKQRAREEKRPDAEEGYEPWRCRATARQASSPPSSAR